MNTYKSYISIFLLGLGLDLHSLANISHYQPRLPLGSKSMSKISTCLLIVQVTSLDRIWPKVNHPWAAADGRRRGPGLPPWILCPTATCFRRKIDTFLHSKSIFLSLSLSKRISVSLPVYFRPFSLSLSSILFFFTHFSLFSLLSSVLCPTLSCVRRQGLPGRPGRPTKYALVLTTKGERGPWEPSMAL